MRPFRWWQPGHRFDGFEHTLRAATARLGAVLALRLATGAPKRELDQLLAVASFLGAYASEEPLEVAVGVDPLQDVRDAAELALGHLPGEGSVLDGAPAHVRAFHEGWRGIVRDEVLALDDRTILTALVDGCSEIIVTKTLAYNVVRKCGDQHLDELDAALESLFPADQLCVLEALTAFPKHRAVAAFLRPYGSRSVHPIVRESAERYAARVEGGEKPSGSGA